MGLDVYMWLNKVTLDIIGLAGNLLSIALLLATPVAHSESHVGFNCEFDSLHSLADPAEKKKDIYGAIRSVLSTSNLPDPFFAVQLFFPLFRLIVSILLHWNGKEGRTELTNYSIANSPLSCS